MILYCHEKQTSAFAFRATWSAAQLLILVLVKQGPLWFQNGCCSTDAHSTVFPLLMKSVVRESADINFCLVWISEFPLESGKMNALCNDGVCMCESVPAW